MSKAACKCKAVECEECPEWIFTLADLIMCMMGLFVILWCLKPGGAGAGDAASKAAAEQRHNEVIAGIREGFGHHPNPDSTDPIDMIILFKGAGEGNQGREMERRAF